MIKENKRNENNSVNNYNSIKLFWGEKFKKNGMAVKTIPILYFIEMK